VRHGCFVVESDPDAGNERRVEPDEPRIPEIVRRPRLAGHGSSDHLDPLAGALLNDVLEYVGRQVGNPRIDDLFLLRDVLLQHMTRPIDDLFDEEGLYPLALIGENAEPADHFLEGQSGGSEGQGQVPRQG